jgi:hypothetical protein
MQMYNTVANSRILALCLWTVYEYSYALSQTLDPRSESRGVLQFKTGLLSVIKVNLGSFGLLGKLFSIWY